MRLAFGPQKTRVNGAVVTQDLIPTDALRARAEQARGNRAEAVVIPTGYEHPAERAHAREQQADRPVHVTLPYCREDNTVVHHE